MANNEEGPVKVARITLEGQIIVAIITLIGVVIAAVLAFPPVVSFFQRTPTPTATLSQIQIIAPVSTLTETIIPSAIVITPSSYAQTVTPTPPSSEMSVILLPNRLGGPLPLNIQVNARGSFVKFSDGSTTTCMQSPCEFIWSIYHEDQIIYGPELRDGTLSYSFKSAGTYFIKVRVCREDVCANSEIQIVATKK